MVLESLMDRQVEALEDILLEVVRIRISIAETLSVVLKILEERE
jgi:hypothetical protein